MTRSSGSALSQLAALASTHLGGRSPRDTIASRPPARTGAHRTPEALRLPKPKRGPAVTDHIANPPQEPPGTERATADDIGGAEAEGQAPVPMPVRDTGTAPGKAGGGPGLQPPKVGLSLRFVRQEELKKRVFEFHRQAAERRRLAPQGLLSTVVAGRDLRDRILEVNLDDDFFRRLLLEVRPATDWSHEGIELTAVSVEYPGELAPGQQPVHAEGYTFSATDAAPRTFTSFLNGQKDMSYRYRTEVHFKASSPWLGQHQVLTGDWQASRSRPLVVNALDAIELFPLKVAADATLFEDVRLARVQLEYDDEQADWHVGESFVLDPQNPDHTWQLRLSTRGLRRYRYTVEYVLGDGGQRFTSGPHEADDPTLVIGSPFRNTKRLRLVPGRDLDGVLEAIVDVTYEEPEHGYRKDVQHVFTGDTLRSEVLAIDTLAAVPQPVRYRLTLVRDDGTVFESPERTTEASVIPVTAGDGAAHRVRLQLAADAAALAPYYAVELQLREPSGEVESEVFVASEATGDAPLERVVWLDGDEDEALTYDWRWLGYRRDGGVDERPFVTDTDDRLVVHLG